MGGLEIGISCITVYSIRNQRPETHTHLLEHLAAIISPWVDILACYLKNQDCILLMTNSMTAEGWLKKSNFSKSGNSPTQASVMIEAAWKQATLFLSLGIKC
jgi:hypothetical protein